MHNQIIASTGMDHESHLAHDNNNNNTNHNIYGNDSWGVDMSSHHYHPTTMPEYGNNYGYIPPITHGLPSEALSRMGPPPHPQSIHQPQPNHPQLPMLMMPHQTTTTWPSQLVSNGQSPYNHHPVHSVPPIPIPSGPALKTKLPAIQTSQPRKTLTDDDRRRMCQYAEDHPNAKQTDIGARFGVERSTVSKVLRQKEKYLSQDDRINSPIKRGKGKGVDIEKALTKWLHNNRQKGIHVTSEEIKERAKVFATAGGGPGANTNSAWLDKFMQKNGLPGRLMRRASETNIGDSLRRGSPALSASQPSSAISPASPSGHLSPSPLSANKSDEEKENSTHHSFIDFNSDNAYKHTTSQSTASLPSSYADTPTTSYPGSALSPTASFNFSPHSNLGSFPSADGQSNGFQRPRSQTFPTLDLEYINQSQNQNSEPMTPKYPVASSTAPSSALEPPSSELGGQNYSLEHAISPQLRRTSSNGSIAGRSTTPLTASAVGSSPSSPTQEDARKAADTLLSFIQSNNLGDHHEIMTILKLTEKLRIHQAQLAKAAAHGMGGLSRIPEGDSEMPNAPPAVEVKIEQTTRA